MGRELRRKEEKKNNKNKTLKRKEELNTGVKVSTIVKLVLSTTIVLLATYYSIALFITKEINISWSKDSETTENVNTVQNKILAKNTFNQKDSLYYVYFYDFSDEDATIASLVNNSELKIYRVDTGSALNQRYITKEESNRDVQSIADLKVKAPSLIMVVAGQVAAYYEGSSEIIGFLGK